MEYVLLYIGSVIVSIGMNISTFLTVVKDIADEGYLFDIKRINETDFGTNKTTLINIFIPFINLVDAFRMKNEYFNYQFETLNTLKTMGIINEMTQEQKEEYLKKQTSLSALKIDLKKLQNKEVILNECYKEKEENKIKNRNTEEKTREEMIRELEYLKEELNSNDKEDKTKIYNKKLKL